MVLLWCAAPILAIVHANAEVHRYCAEHGALEEAGDASNRSAVAEPAGRLFDASETAPSHTGCAFARFCRFGQSPGPVVFSTTGDIEISLIPAPPLLQPAAIVPVIRIAPKTSPPV
jgi:hypothetical protein